MGTAPSSSTFARILVDRSGNETCFGIDPDFLSQSGFCDSSLSDQYLVIVTREQATDHNPSILAGVIFRPGVEVVGFLAGGRSVRSVVSGEGTFVLESDSGVFESVLIGPKDAQLRCVTESTSLAECHPEPPK